MHSHCSLLFATVLFPLKMHQFLKRFCGTRKPLLFYRLCLFPSLPFRYDVEARAFNATQIHPYRLGMLHSGVCECCAFFEVLCLTPSEVGHLLPCLQLSLPSSDTLLLSLPIFQKERVRGAAVHIHLVGSQTMFDKMLRCLHDFHTMTTDRFFF